MFKYPILFIFCISMVVFSSNDTYEIELVRGLQDDVHSIVKDRNGTLWRSSRDGYSFYNGNSWIKINTDNGDPRSDQHIAIDSSGAIWIGVESRHSAGIHRYKDGAWTHYNDVNVKEMIDIEITCIHVDENNVKWFGTGHAGILKYDDVTWERFDTSNSGISAARIHSITSDTSGQLWISTSYHGIVKYNGTTWKVYESELPDYNSRMVVHNSYFDAKTNRVFFANWAGILIYDNNNNIWKEIEITAPISTGWSRACTAMGIDAANNIWAAFVPLKFIQQEYYDTANLYIINENSIRELNIGYLCDTISTICIDDSSNVWVGTRGYGTYRIKNNELVNTFFKKGTIDILSQSKVSIIKKADNISFGFGLENSNKARLAIYNSKGQIVKEVSRNFTKRGLNTFTIKSSDFPNGFYIVRIYIGKETLSCKMYLVN